MDRFRSPHIKRLAAILAVFGMLIQAGLAVWHGTAMFAHAAGQGGGAQAEMMCHADAPRGVLGGGSDPMSKDCSCCLGLLSVAAEPIGQNDIKPKLEFVEEVAFAITTTVSGRHPLAPESRGPPHLI